MRGYVSILCVLMIAVSVSCGKVTPEQKGFTLNVNYENSETLFCTVSIEIPKDSVLDGISLKLKHKNDVLWSKQIGIEPEKQKYSIDVTLKDVLTVNDLPKPTSVVVEATSDKETSRSEKILLKDWTVSQKIKENPKFLNTALNNHIESINEYHDDSVKVIDGKTILYYSGNATCIYELDTPLSEIYGMPKFSISSNIGRPIDRDLGTTTYKNKNDETVLCLFFADYFFENFYIYEYTLTDPFVWGKDYNLIEKNGEWTRTIPTALALKECRLLERISANGDRTTIKFGSDQAFHLYDNSSQDIIRSYYSHEREFGPKNYKFKEHDVNKERRDDFGN